MTVVLEVNDIQEAADTAMETSPIASWGARAGALVIDVVFGAAVVTAMAMLAWISPWLSTMWWLFTVIGGVVVLAVLVNRWLLPAWTGWTLGRAVTGIRVLGRSGANAGVARLMLRDVAHLLDTAAVLLGWFWPLWDRRGRTFADLLLRTEVHRVGEPTRELRRPVAVGLLVTALVCGAAAGLGYGVAYRQDRAVDAARTQIAEQGPRIVEQMLSYTPETLKGDFERARSLATDDYRPQLVAQQEAVEKSPIVANEYWTVNSAVLQAEPKRATMLLAMQGQRGADPNTLKFITATVQVEFDRSNGQWRVQDLTVLTRPQPAGAGPR